MSALILLIQVASDVVVEPPTMNAFSWAFMLISMGAVTGLTVWSFARILRGRRHFDPDGTGPASPPVPGRADRP